MAMGVYKRTDWNAIIAQVNALATHPSSGCDPVSTLPTVAAEHRWSKADIRAIQAKLKEICKDNTFTAIPDKWKRSIIDEINTAIAKNWCDCEQPCQPCEFAYPRQLLFTVPGRWDLSCPWDYGCAGCGRGTYCHFMDWAASLRGVQVGAPGYAGRWWSVYRHNLATDERTNLWIVFANSTSGLIGCDGKIIATQDTSGNKGMGLAEPGGYEVEVYGGCGGCTPSGGPLMSGMIPTEC
jgi:hypothetical protein